MASIIRNRIKYTDDMRLPIVTSLMGNVSIDMLCDESCHRQVRALYGNTGLSRGGHK